MFDVVAGFVQSQVLAALVELDVLEQLMEEPHRLRRLAARSGVPEDRMRILADAGVALGLMRKVDDTYSIARRGAALTGVPGLPGMIRHHGVLYRDLADPVAFFRGETQTELAQFWPYVFGAGAAEDPETAERYSRLMAESQGLVAEETLATTPLDGVRHLMDVGGGTGAFLSAALRRYPAMQATLFDLPQVVAGAEDVLADASVADRVTIRPGSFRDDPLPEGPDAISLVRVLYDHADETVAALLAEVHRVLPPGGRVIVSEPMAGGAAPSRAGDAYFAVYTLAMQTGRTRSAEEIGQALSAAGFGEVKPLRTVRPFVTSVVTAQKT